jgi:hypothetical protein
METGERTDRLPTFIARRNAAGIQHSITTVHNSLTAIDNNLLNNNVDCMIHILSLPKET